MQQRTCPTCGTPVLADEGWAFCKRCNKWIKVSRRALSRVKKSVLV